MKELQTLQSPMVAKHYRETINNNFTDVKKALETLEKDSLDISNELFDRIDSLGYLKDLNTALNKELTEIKQNQIKILEALDILYNAPIKEKERERLEKLEVLEKSRKVALETKPEPKPWYKW